MEERERWVKIETLIEQSLALSPEKRSGFLKRECGTDEGLRTEIESLLLFSDTADKFIRDISENVVSPSFEEILELRLPKDDELQIIGQTIAHYKIIEKLGSGGMGIVYKARDTKLNRVVALKFLIPRFLQSGDNTQQLMLEAQAAAALSHPNICTIYQINEYDGQQFIVMEFIDGVTLREKINHNDISSGIKESKLNTETAVGYSIQIAEALQEAHEKKIIHRDIKPENLMVDSKNRIKVTDFGLAKLIGTGDLTKIRSALGTLAYMSPEQIKNETVDQRSDIFSFGVVLYEMLAGLHPFRSEKELDTIHSIVNKDPVPLSELIPQKSVKLAELVNRMLEKNPDNRYQSSHLLVNDLKRCSETLPIPFETTETAPYSVRFRAKMLSSATILALLLFAGYWFWFPGSEPAAGNLHNSIAVLALENLSSAPDDAYFADVIHEEMINLLAGIRSLTVISRSSITGYPIKERDLQQIGRDLGVSSVLEGSVLLTGEQLTLSMQLIDTGSLATLWSGSFEDHVDDIYKIQSQIAVEVAEVLGAALTPDEQQRLDGQPTENPVAYNLYIRAREYYSRPSVERDNYLSTEILLKRALEEDPRFAHAYALLAITYSNLYWFFGQTPERLQQIKEAAEQAQLLAPDLPETHLALGLYFYWSDTHYNRPLSHFQTALQQFPNHPQLQIFMGLTHRWAGNWKQSEEHLKKALELDPRNFTSYQELAWLYIWIREYDKAEIIVNRQIESFPDRPLYIYIAFISYHRDGSFEGLRTWGKMRPQMQELEIYFFGNYNYYNRDWESALRTYKSIKTEIAADTDNDYIPRLYLIAKTLQAQSDSATSLLYYEQVRAQLEALRDEYPDDPRYRATLGKVYASIGEPEKAVREGEIALDLVPYEQNAYLGAWIALDLAEIYTLAGNYDEAIDKLEFLLSVPGFVSKNDLQLSPKWNPLRNQIKFQNLIEL